MSDSEGFLVSIIILLVLVAGVSIGQIKHSPCDFSNVTAYQDISRDEMTVC